MVSSQIESRGVKDRRVLDALRKVPRHLFVLPELTDEAYDDNPLSIGHHTIVATWFFAEPLCDGVATAMAQDGQGGSCYLAGWEHGFQPMYGVDKIDVTVVPGK